MTDNSKIIKYAHTVGFSSRPARWAIKRDEPNLVSILLCCCSFPLIYTILKSTICGGRRIFSLDWEFAWLYCIVSNVHPCFFCHGDEVMMSHLCPNVEYWIIHLQIWRPWRLLTSWVTNNNPAGYSSASEPPCIWILCPTKVLWVLLLTKGWLLQLWAWLWRWYTKEEEGGSSLYLTEIPITELQYSTFLPVVTHKTFKVSITSRYFWCHLWVNHRQLDSMCRYYILINLIRHMEHYCTFGPPGAKWILYPGFVDVIIYLLF